MAANPETQTDRAAVWLKPEQVDAMRSATVAASPDYLAARNDALIATLYDTGLRIGECVGLDVDMLDLDDAVIGLPAGIQKDYPTEGSPEYTRLDLNDGTVRTLRMYLSSRWRDSPAVFPSRERDRITAEAARNVVRAAAVEAGVRPFTQKGRGEAGQVTPHTLRHSVAYRMLDREEGKTLFDVTRRLRHSSIQTTERIYAHFDRV